MPESGQATVGVCPWCTQPILADQDSRTNRAGLEEHEDCWEEHCCLCVHCETLIDTRQDAYDLMDGDHYCESCSQEYLALCNACENLIYRDDMYTNRYGDAYCEDCYHEHYDECPNCQSEYSRDEGTTVQHDEQEEWCRSCVSDHSRVCYACNERTSQQHCHLTNDGFALCDRCREGEEHLVDFTTCDDCSQWYHRGNIEDGLCYSCAGSPQEVYPPRRDEPEPPRARRIGEPEQWNPREVINNYSYKPAPNFRFAPDRHQTSHLWRNNALFYGIELEVTCRLNKRQDAMHSWVEADPEQLWYFKSDASVSEGFEAVSHPFHFGWLQENIEQFVKPIEASSAFTRGYTYSSAGMHIHMSRQAFSHLHLMKFCRFFYNNPGFIMQMSRRLPQCIYNYGNPWLETGESAGLVHALKIDGGMRFMQRNAAINLNNRSTIECRIFRSTTTRSGVIANIEFLHGAYNFTKQSSLTDLKPGIFLDWMSRSNKEFPFFNEVLLPRAAVGLEGGD